MKWYSKNGKKILCFSRDELLSLYRNTKHQEITDELKKRNISVNDLRNDRAKMEEISEDIGGKGAHHRDEHEVFASLFVFSDFYGPKTDICFEMLDSFDPNKDTISSLGDLNRLRKVDSDSDFLLLSKDGFRSFQLKRYRGLLETQPLFEAIVKIVRHYANNLGDTNLLIQLQGPAGVDATVDFQELHNLIKSQNYKFGSSILISYNDSDQRILIITVYPGLGKTEIPVRYPSTRDS